MKALADAMKQESESETPKLETAVEIFKKVAGEHTTVEVQPLRDGTVPAVLTVSEESRRMDDMMKMYSMNGDGMGSFPLEAKLILNASSPLIAKIDSEADEDRREKLARQVYGLSLLSQRKLTAEELKKFLADSYELLGLL